MVDTYLLFGNIKMGYNFSYFSKQLIKKFCQFCYLEWYGVCAACKSDINHL